MDRQEGTEQAEPKTRDKGFTLIELLIVIAILGILSTIVVLSVRGITDRGQDSACKSDYKTLEVAHEAAISKGETITYVAATDAEADLVAAGFLVTASDKYNIVSASDIDPSVGSACTYDPS